MDALRTKLRIERKFVPVGYSLNDALALVRAHPAVFKEVYPPRWVNNLYLDTPDFRFYREHVHGSAHRMKVRIRWYGAFDGPVKEPALEIKKRFGVTGGKDAFPFPPFSINGRMPRQVILESFHCERLPELGRIVLRELDIVLCNRYWRHYFLSGDGSVRLTVDSDVEFYRSDGTDSGFRVVRPTDINLIIELKYDPAHAERAAAIADAFPFRPTRCSKYVLGVKLLLG